MIDRTKIVELFRKNYSEDDILELLIERMTVKEIEQLIQDDQDLEPERAMVESGDHIQQ